MADELLPSLISTYDKLKRACSNEMVFLTGPPSIGKTTLVKRLFEEKQKEYLHAYIDCYSFKNSGQLLSQICQAFHCAMNVRRNRAGASAQKLPEQGAPVSLNDFYDALMEYKDIALAKGYKRIFVVFDQVEALERTPMMDTFIALCRYNAEGIRLILISCENPMDIIHHIARKSPAIALSVQDRCQVVMCKEWSVEDIINWILRMPPKRDAEIYKKFVKNVVTLVTKSDTKNPSMIRMYCQDHFGDFINLHKQQQRKQIVKRCGLDPKEEDRLTDEESDRYELECGSNVNMVRSFLKTFKVTIRNSKDNSKWTSLDVETRVPKNSAMLLVAAYIAAYTKLSDDKLNFVQLQRKKSSSRRKEETDPSNRPFTLERLVQIYLGVMKMATGDKILNCIYNNDCVLADIARLIELDVLHHQGGFQICSESRLKLSSNVRKEYVYRLAKNHKLSLSHYQGLPEYRMDEEKKETDRNLT